MVYPLTLHVTFLFKTTPKTAAGESENTTVTPQEDGSYLVTVDYPLTTGNLSGVTAKDENGEETLSADPMKFSANYRYNFAIYLTRGNIRILAIAPTVYDWVYEEVEADDAIVGQPVTLGGLMWMDRNLGASTWDAENDFYGSIGYYYQFGRNIPFILDSAQFIYFTHDDDIKSFDWKDSRGPCIGRATDTTTTEWYNPYHAWTSIHKITPTMQEQDSLRKCQVRCFYTYDYFGDTVCNHFFSAGSNAFRFPGQVTYKSKSTEIDTVATHRNYRFAVNKGSTSQSQTWTSANSSARDYWKDLDNQPCPKGWRLPTHQDLYSFMPWGGRVVWYSYGNIYMTATSTKASPSTHYWNYGPEVTKNKSNSYTDEYNATWTEGTLGWYRRDVGDADTGDFEGSIQEIRFGQKGSKAAGYYHVIYMLKWAGTDKAYRIRIMSKFAKGHINRDQYSTNKRYISISRYAAEKDKTLDDYVQNGNDETMWDNPIETLLYPCAGFLVTDANASDLRSFGTGLVARTSEANPTETSSSWVQYLTTATFNVNVENSSRRSLGDQVRCCRDISASY
jgi:IS1 family transposase